VGGIALLGVGVIAAFAGLITTTQGNGNGTVAQAPTASAGVLESTAPAAGPTEPAVASPPPDAARMAPAPATPFVPGATGDGTAVGAAPPASAVPAPAPAPAEPAPPAVAAPAPAPGGSSSVPHGSLRVYNNSLIQGLAARAAADFRSAGWTVAEIGGYPGATIPTSTVYYRPGTDEQTVAQEIGRAFGLRVEPRFAGIQSASPGVIVIVTREYRSPGKS
jgi:hypothetical protein